jgi:hypothetical protein
LETGLRQARRPAPATLPPDVLAHVRAMARERLVRIEVDDVKHATS